MLKRSNIFRVLFCLDGKCHDTSRLSIGRYAFPCYVGVQQSRPPSSGTRCELNLHSIADNDLSISSLQYLIAHKPNLMMIQLISPLAYIAPVICPSTCPNSLRMARQVTPPAFYHLERHAFLLEICKTAFCKNSCAHTDTLHHGSLNPYDKPQV